MLKQIYNLSSLKFSLRKSLDFTDFRIANYQNWYIFTSIKDLIKVESHKE